MNEEWKEIKGNREVYEVSNLGNVRTKDRIGARGRSMAMKLGVSPQTITDIVNNRSWKHE